MAEPVTTLMDTLRDELGDAVLSLTLAHGEVTLEVAPERFAQIARQLRDDIGFEQLMDLCGVDYLSYGDAEWDTRDVSSEGFSRAVEGKGAGRFVWGEQPGGVDGIKPGIAGRRYAVVVHLLSIRDNRRLRVRCYCADDALPVVPSLIDVWPGVNWFEREAFDLFGIIFDGHPDLRRLLTDYGFVGHPFRKDFPLIGNVEVRYDADKQRVIYEPVSIEPRVLVPRVIRDDSRWEQAANEFPDHAKPRPPMPAPGSAQTRTEN